MSLKKWFTALSALVSIPVVAQDSAVFTISDIQANHTVSELLLVPFFKAGEQVLVAKGRTADNEKMFSFYEVGLDKKMKESPSLTVLMPEAALFYDFASLTGDKKQSLLFLNSEGVQRFDPERGGFETLAALSSMYRKNESPLFEALDFARDLNGDGCDDLIMPDFHGYWLRLNDCKGNFQNEILLNMQVEMRLSRQRPLYSQFPLYTADVNFDGKIDILFQKDKSFVAFLQKADGSFATDPSLYEIDIDVIGNSFAEFIRSDERYEDQTDLTETRIVSVEDINGDNIIDIVAEKDRAKGLFDRSTTYQFHYGSEVNKRLTFRPEPSTSIKLEGIKARNRYIDFTGDGRKDFVVGSVKIGIGKIIGILLSGSVGIHVNFYEQDEKGTYSKKPTFRKKVSVDFDMSSGQSSISVAEMADINGDKAKDMILGKGTDKLRIYMATPTGKKLFKKKDIELKVDLPKNGELVTTEDVNDDGKGDLLIHFDRLGADGENNKNRFMVLIAN